MTDNELLDELVLRWQDEKALGHELSAAELCRECPTLQVELESRLDGLRAMERLIDGFNSPKDGTLIQSVLPSLPGFEILGELGRGGMGVVYKARDLSLKRIVALKMIIQGDFASAEQLARFQTEAEALAQLHHPHIVQIFASAACQGRPCFVMECVEGGSLNHKLEGKPQPARDAARMILHLSRGVHAAHQRGIIHRDLKPANVLLAAPADEPALNTAYGCPRITDFGLAKLASGGDSAKQQTASGAVQGTPSYMAPEQAGGKSRLIGPATDVYALGAILYEMLTGRPPFKNDSPVETLMDVIAKDPEPPSRIQQDVPAELERICLKCLSKDPAQRYPSAAELATDCTDFLADEAMAAYPLPPAMVQQHNGNAEVPVKPEQKGRFNKIHVALTSLAVLLLVTLAGYGISVVLPMLVGHPQSSPPPPPTRNGSQVVGETLQGEFLVRVFTTKKTWRKVDDPLALPARPGDLVHLEANFNQPAYAYILWLGSQGDVIPLYPWNKEDEVIVENFKVPPPPQDPRKKINSPVGEQQGWALDSKPGLETLLLLARKSPLPDKVSLASLLGPLPPAKLNQPGELAELRFDRGLERLVYDVELNRGIEKKAHAADHSLGNLMGKLRDEFEIIRAVRFSHAAD